MSAFRGVELKHISGTYLEKAYQRSLSTYYSVLSHAFYCFLRVLVPDSWPEVLQESHSSDKTA
jgi:hypothetical protein